jgi:glucose-6-phosphate isomerase, archaeal
MQCWKGPMPSPDIRTIEDMRLVLADPSCGETGPLYYMYRDLARTFEDRVWLSRHSLRYDITIISSRTFCGEYAKTKGHYHPAAPSGIGYPELYQVLEGKAHYLLQTRDLSDVILVRAEAGDLVLVPPSYGHVTINPGPSDLVMANMVSSAFTSDYRDYEQRRGGVYYELSDGRIIRNPAYPHAPPIRSHCAADIRHRMGFSCAELYDLVGGEDLLFLNFPGRYPELFRVYQGD